METTDKWLLQVGRNIRAERTRRGWSREALASDADVSSMQIARMERGEMDTGILKYLRVARALGIDPTVLLQGVEL